MAETYEIGGKDYRRDQLVSFEPHIHPPYVFGGWGGLGCIMDAMGVNDLDIVALHDYGGKGHDTEINLWERLKEEAKGKPIGIFDDAVIRFVGPLYKTRYIVRGRECQTGDDFHVLAIGHSEEIVDSGGFALSSVIKEIHDKGGLAIISHPYVDSLLVEREISDYTEEMDLAGVHGVCSARNLEMRPDAIEFNSYCDPRIRWMLGGKNVNELALDLGKGTKMSVVSGHDLHARELFSLWYWLWWNKTENMIPKEDLDFSDGRSLVESLRGNIRSNNFYPNYKIANPFDFVFNFGLPELARRAKGFFN